MNFTCVCVDYSICVYSVSISGVRVNNIESNLKMIAYSKCVDTHTHTHTHTHTQTHLCTHTQTYAYPNTHSLSLSLTLSLSLSLPYTHMYHWWLPPQKDS